MRALGVGLVYWPELEPLFACGTGLVSVLELEPQTAWDKIALGSSEGPGHRYQPRLDVMQRVAALPQHKLLHGIGHPLAATCRDPADPWQAWQQSVAVTSPHWVSEHLSFNRAQGKRGAEHAGFLLPPLQTAATVRVAAQNIRDFRRVLGRPVAFETGVNYLEHRTGEMSDGRFFRGVSEQSDCGILLDLHNLWANEKNGRDSVRDVVATLPLERVWEVHLAGGESLHGRWLDSHCDVADADLIELCAEILPTLPNLGALIFEILPQHALRIGLDRVAQQLEVLGRMWRLPRVQKVVLPFPQSASIGTPSSSDYEEVRAWERATLDAIQGRSAPQGPWRDLGCEPGVALYRELIRDFRRSQLVGPLRYTLTLLLLQLGRDRVHALLDRYAERAPYDPYDLVEADGFATFLMAETTLGDLDYVCEVLRFEKQAIHTTAGGEPRAHEWTFDAGPLFDALDRGRLPARAQSPTARSPSSAPSNSPRSRPS